MKYKRTIVAAVSFFSVVAAFAQRSAGEAQLLTVNENVTTVITASEPVRFVDISTDKVVGDQPINNTIRLKPKEGVEVNRDGDVLAVVTIVTERYRTQYALIYTSRMDEAVTDKTVEVDERTPYHNPAVSMSTEDMVRYARQIWSSPARYKNVATKQHRMAMRLNNIYSVGKYFFLDFSVENKTNIRFDESYDTIFEVLMTDTELAPLLGPFRTAFQNNAMEQLEGMIGTIKYGLEKKRKEPKRT